jgi:hypothetical protein
MKNKIWNKPPFLAETIVVVLILALLTIVANVFAQQEAQNLWKVIETKSGVKKPLTFISTTDVPGSYRIQGDTIYYSDERNNPGSVFAVARLAEEIYDAIMIRPGSDGIIIQKNEGWKRIEAEYTPLYVRNNWVNRPTNPDNRTWLYWHHIPNKGSLDSTFWHLSWFEGMCLRYPQLAPKDGRIITEQTKPDITHPDFPKIIYDEWVARGRPAFCNLFELDGTGFWWMNQYYLPPANLNLGERETFVKAVNQGTKPLLAIGSSVRASDGKRYPITANLFTALNAIPNQNKYPKAPNFRHNYNAFYLDVFIKIREYFDKQGDDHVIFNILAYSSYRCLPHGDYDLRRFHVYYTSQTAQAWDWDEMIMDAKEFVKWKSTAAKVIWRPNFILRPQDRLIYSLVTTYIQLTQPDGFQIPPYTSPSWPLGHGIDYYAIMRTMQGKPYSDYFKYVPDGWMLWHNSMILKGAAKPDKEEDDI